jgi:hypothetical protein
MAAFKVLHFRAYAKYWRGAMNKELAGPLYATALIHPMAIEEACLSGYRYYDIGVPRPGSSLARFKEKIAGEHTSPMSYDASVYYSRPAQTCRVASSSEP